MHPELLDVHLIRIMLPLMVYIYTQVTTRYMRLAMLAVMGFSVLSILTTQSRGAFLAVIATVAYLWWRSKKKLLIGAVIVVAAPLFFFAMPPFSPWYRIWPAWNGIG